MKQDARDPYVGLNAHIRSQAQSQLRSHYAVGQVLSIRPLRVRADGLDLEGNDLMVAQGLLLEAHLPARQLAGKCSCALSSGDCYVTRGAETVPWRDAATGTARGWGLAAGDWALLIPSEDGQTYFLVDKLTEVGGA